MLKLVQVAVAEFLGLLEQSIQEAFSQIQSRAPYTMFQLKNCPSTQKDKDDKPDHLDPRVGDLAVFASTGQARPRKLEGREDNYE